MRSWKLAVFAAGLLAAGPGLAEEGAPAAAAPNPEAQAVPAPTEPEAAPSQAGAVAKAPVPEAAAGEAQTQTPSDAPGAAVLGEVGFDAQGRQGRIHVVRKGDTLWDISDAYLGTPWVWPSVWRGNRDIANPHLIRPGDRIWITADEMRPVSDAEAEALLAGEPAPDPVPAALDADAMPDFSGSRGVFRMPSVQTTGFVTEEMVTGEASIVESPASRVWLQDHDEVVIGLGEGQVEVGDKLSIFRPGEKIEHPETGKTFGYATDELGWMEVTEVRLDGATGVIRLSRSEIRRGDHVRPLEVRPPEIPVGPKPDVAGHVVYTPDSRLHMGSQELVYLDRGTQAGLAVGSPLEVFRPFGEQEDEVADKLVEVPDHVVAKLVVVEAHPEASVAVITHTSEDLVRGDRFRGTQNLTW